LSEPPKTDDLPTAEVSVASTAPLLPAPSSGTTPALPDNVQSVESSTINPDLPSTDTSETGLAPAAPLPFSGIAPDLTKFPEAENPPASEANLIGLAPEPLIQNPPKLPETSKPVTTSRATPEPGATAINLEPKQGMPADKSSVSPSLPDKTESRNPKAEVSNSPSAFRAARPESEGGRIFPLAGGGRAASENDQTTPQAAPIAGPAAVDPARTPPLAASGTGVATIGQSMKFGAQMNEFAGSSVQELPPGSPVALLPGAPNDAGPEAKTILPVDFSSFKDSAFQWLASDPAPKTAMTPVPTANAEARSQPLTGALGQAERLISREVVMVRQSGAEALAVSLKVDAHTSLFLQLTNHNGQIEATVRCEKGDAGALGGHWGQLQESLARQNVQLQPLEDKPAPVKLPSDTAAGQKDFHQKQPNPPPAAPSPGKEVVPSDDAMTAAVGLSKSKHNPHPHHGWEKWA
jgi:hypothetical protein